MTLNVAVIGGGTMDLVIESVPESPGLKRPVLAAAEKREPAVLATDTSTLSVDRLAEDLARPGAFCGMHFFNPVAIGSFAG